jgi:alkylated DNA repair dioxygenase AlkB
MEQLSFFEEAGQSKGLPTAMLEYVPGLIDPVTGDKILNELINNTNWKQPIIRMYDKDVLSPRLMGWYGDANGRIADIAPWTPSLLMIKEKVEARTGFQFNAVLVNYYRDGNDSVAWHSDKESVPGRKTTVGSVSFGQVRSFDIRNKYNHDEKYSVKLEHGSFLFMKPGMQDYWEHRIAKSTRPMKPRLNLTFRIISSSAPTE